MVACGKYGVQFTMEYFFTLTGVPPIQISKQLVEKFKMDVDVHQLYTEKEAIVKEKLKDIKLIKPVADLVHQYHGKLPLAVGTGSVRKLALELLENAKLLHLFDHIITSDDVDNYKPHPETFLKCAELMNVSPAYCQVFEDGKLGIQAGHAAGMMVTDVKPYYEQTIWN